MKLSRKKLLIIFLPKAESGFMVMDFEIHSFRVKLIEIIKIVNSI